MALVVLATQMRWLRNWNPLCCREVAQKLAAVALCTRLIVGGIALCNRCRALAEHVEPVRSKVRSWKLSWTEEFSNSYSELNANSDRTFEPLRVQFKQASKQFSSVQFSSLSDVADLSIFSSISKLYLYSEGTQASTLIPVACLLLVSFPFVLLPLCLIISVDSHPHC